MNPVAAPAGRLRALDGAALVVTTVVGAGIFTVPAIVASLTGSAAAFLAVWVIGGLLALAGALTYAELATRMPEAGGEYVYLREAFGSLVGFLSGWTSFVAGFSGAIAASAVGFAAHLGSTFPAMAGAPWLVVAIGPLRFTISALTITAVVVIALFTIVAVSGVEAGRRATNAMAAVLVATMVGFVVVGYIGVAPTHAPLRAMPATAGIATALVPVMFTYSGWNAAAYLANEFTEPRRSIPRALVGGALVVTVLYVGVNAMYLRALGTGGLASAAAPAADAADAALGRAGGTIVATLVLIALASSVCAMVVTGPRIYVQMARDGALPPVFARARARDGTPTIAIIAQSIWSGVLVLTGTFESLVAYTGAAIVLFSGAAVATIFIFRRRGAGAGYRIPGYPVVPLAYVAATAWMLVAVARYQPMASLAGVALIAAGIPLYVRKRSRAWRRLQTAPVSSP